MKTNKSYSKRLRVTRKGKIVSRAPGHNHFNARASGSARMAKRRAGALDLTNAEKSRYLPNA